jgi:hypothetical protein
VSRFQVGDRVRGSGDLRKLHPRVASRQGTVRIIATRMLAGESVSTIFVRWNGRASDEGLHESYLELVERPNGVPAESSPLVDLLTREEGAD